MGETTFPYPSQQNKSKKTKQTIIIGIVVLVAVLIGLLLFMQQSKKTNENKPTVVEKTEPSPTEKPKIEKATVKIQVLNGTGTPGQAGLAVKALEDAGYSTDNIKSSNAEKYDNLSTRITARVGYEEIVNDIKDILQPTFDEVTIDSSNLDTDSEFDVVVVTGGKILETESPTPSPTTAPDSTPSPTPSLTPSPTPTP